MLLPAVQSWSQTTPNDSLGEWAVWMIRIESLTESESVLLTYLIDSFMFLISEFKKLKVKMSGGYDYPDNILKKNYKIK